MIHLVYPGSLRPSRWQRLWNQSYTLHLDWLSELSGVTPPERLTNTGGTEYWVYCVFSRYIEWDHQDDILVGWVVTGHRCVEFHFRKPDSLDRFVPRDDGALPQLGILCVIVLWFHFLPDTVSLPIAHAEWNHSQIPSQYPSPSRQSHRVGI